VPEENGEMSVHPAEESADADRLPWYIYDRHVNLLRVAHSFAAAEAWAFAHWGVVEVAEREEIGENDYFYLLFAEKPQKGDFHARDFQARIVRKDRVIALGRDPETAPRYTA
jgi:hypothetical protein